MAIQIHERKFTSIPDPGPVGLPVLLRQALIGLGVAGALVWIVSAFVYGGSDSPRAWQALLLNYMFFLMLGLGGIVFTAIQYASSARWAIVVRRIAEATGIFVPVGLVFFLIIALIGYGPLYRFAPEAGGYEFTSLKGAFLSQPAMIVKGLLFYAVWIVLVHRIRRTSLEQDRTRDAGLSKKNTRLSIGFLILFAYTFSLHCVDMLMALDAKWFSTMFGVYCFSGLFLSSMALIALVVLAMRRRRPVGDLIQPRHLYDLGTWLMAFSCFMIYIGFSQYMLIWYANLPEESFYMVIRTKNGWQFVLLLLPLLKWVVPFLVLMPQGFRGHPKVLALVSVAILVGQWIDLYWLIYPVFSAERVVLPGLAEAGAFFAILAAFAVALDRVYRKHSVLPVGDPHLLMSVNGSYV